MRHPVSRRRRFEQPLSGIRLGIAALVATALPVQAADTADQLFNSRFCFACHGVSKSEVKKLGPYIAEVADKYRARPDAAVYLSSRVLGGSEGVWGDAKVSVMPPNKLTSEEASLLVQWILQQK